MNDILKAIERRSSTRGYTDQKPTKEELDILLNAGLMAPTAANRQEIHISVLDGSSPILAEIEAERMKGAAAPHNFYYEAPVVMILSGDTSLYWSAVDAGIAVEKAFQPGGARLRAEGLRIESLARIGSMSDDGLTFIN